MTIGSGERQGLLKRLLRLTRNVDTAEDCLQSAFLRLEEYRRNCAVENEIGFLAHAATNIAIDEARRQRTRAEVGDGVQLLQYVRDAQPLQDEVLVARERLSRAGEVLEQLPERTRDVFLMHRFARLKYRDIAARLGISVSAVEKHIAKASLALAACVHEVEDAEVDPNARTDRGSRSGGLAGAPALGRTRVGR